MGTIGPGLGLMEGGGTGDAWGWSAPGCRGGGGRGVDWSGIVRERERGAGGGGVAGGEGKVDGVDAPDPVPVPTNPELRLVTEALRPDGERS